MAASFLLEPKRFILVCDNCFREITYRKRIQCDECILDLCLQCFMGQVETQYHSKYHKYRVVSGMEEDLYGNGWTVLENLLFVEGLEACGIGNWPDVAQYIGSDKNPKQHFYELLAVGDDSSLEAAEIKERTSNPHRGAVSSYMPHRRDFDVEFMNDQEDIMKELGVSGSDDELTRRLTEAALDSYTSVVAMRNRRKHFVLERNLFDVGGLKEKERRLGIENMGDIKRIAPFLTKRDFNTFVSGLHIESELLRLLKRQMETESMIDRERLLGADHLLMASEKKVCDVCKISLKVYLEAKKEILAFYARNKEFPKYKLRKLLGKSDKRVGVLFDFFDLQGWIRRSNAE
jgi:transcriptional adapter 2-beta